MKKPTYIVLTLQNYGYFNILANTFNETPFYFSEYTAKTFKLVMKSGRFSSICADTKKAPSTGRLLSVLFLIFCKFL